MIRTTLYYFLLCCGLLAGCSSEESARPNRAWSFDVGIEETLPDQGAADMGKAQDLGAQEMGRDLGVDMGQASDQGGEMPVDYPAPPYRYACQDEQRARADGGELVTKTVVNRSFDAQG